MHTTLSGGEALSSRLFLTLTSNSSINYRTQFDALGVTPGVMVYFAPTYGMYFSSGQGQDFFYAPGQAGIVGPTNVLHVFDASSDTAFSHDSPETVAAPVDLLPYLADAFIPFNTTYFVDLSEVGLRVTTYFAENQALEVELQFVDYEAEKANFKVDEIMECGAAKVLDEDGLYRVDLADFSSPGDAATSETVIFGFSEDR